MTLTERKSYLQNQIALTKAHVHDLKSQIEDDEKRLHGLYGALETVVEIERMEVNQQPATAQGKE